MFGICCYLGEGTGIVQKYLSENGVQTLIHYLIPIRQQKAFMERNNKILKITEKIQEEVVRLPMSQVIKKRRS